MICAAIGIPTIILGGSLFAITAKLSTPGMGVSPHEVIVDIIRYVAVLFPLLTVLLLYWVFREMNRIVGPIERITRELDERIEGDKTGPIVLRTGDELLPLADKINVLLEEREKLGASLAHRSLISPVLL